MAKRTIVGLIYSYNENWIGGTYYIENILSALLTLKEKDMPHIKLFCSKQEEGEQLIKKISYPYLSIVLLEDKNNYFDKFINKISYIFCNKHIITRGIDTEVDVLFPASFSYLLEQIKNKLFWVPDFQDFYYPKLFNTQELSKRKLFYKKIATKPYKLVLSSNSAMNDWHRFFKNTSTRVFIMPFAVTLPSLDGINVKDVRNKYNLPEKYFICSNQFWAHKNHKIVLSALQSIKNEKIHICFTGITQDQRNPQYFEQLKKIVHEKNLEKKVSFLGFINRLDQLVLMKNSLAIIQPSKFEGWSTVVEDAKALNKEIIVSDIPVHREQLPNYNCFFNPESKNELCHLMNKALNKEIHFPNINYNENIEAFAENFLYIIKSSSY